MSADGTTARGQLAAGFFAWCLAAALAVAFGFNTRNASTPLAFLLIALVGLLGLGAWLYIKRRWKAFIPGVLIGVGMTCLLPVGIVAVVCGNWR